jgi:hypothetical protein
VLCQLSYARLTRTGLLFAGFFVNSVPTKFLVVLLKLQPLSPLRLFRDSVVPQTGFHALQPNEFTCHLLSLDSKCHQRHSPLMADTLTSQMHRTSSGDEIVKLVQNLCYHAGTDRLATFTNSETYVFHHGDRLAEGHLHVDVVARHTHFSTTEQR